jgi:hypothetical protein
MSELALLDAALAYAAAGFPVFALQPRGKKPVTWRGFYAATTNPATIQRMWRIGERNVGIPTGAISGFWVVDVDPGGEHEIERLQGKYGALPPTRTVITPRGGYHLLFKYTGPVPNSAGKIAPAVDARGDGGYVVAVPSQTEVGTYSWFGDPAAPLAIAPPWLLALAREKPPSISDRALAARKTAAGRSGAYGSGSSFGSSGYGSGYGTAALDREITVLAATPAGQRNSRLNRAAFSLYQLVAGGELDGGSVEHRLVEACHANRLIEDDGEGSVTKTIASGRSAGLLHPRSRNRGAS